jgi:hypothetical protein
MQTGKGGKNRILPAEQLPDSVSAPKTTDIAE